ncbi:AMP-binding protein [Vibrio diazotrophicus]|uniref:AMP-binding protein n=1 Tax=Vibrio diazotrophicus TaxID=685 RepID=UPI00142DBE0B|nr:AMP-binding protein [Vibrio diazotrophicus]NIY91007.1 AMP-binding protein [Vibrio diazotrophicus]
MTSSCTAFSSLSQLLLEKRENTLVAFGSEGDITWTQFLADVSDHINLINETPHQIVALCARDSYLFSVGLFALFYAGKTVILPGNYQPEALEELSSQFDLLLCDEAISPLRNTETQLITTGHNNSLFGFAALSPESIQLILFTSGSSGTPKAIHKSLSQLSVEVDILHSLWGEQTSNSRVESTVSHQHIYGLLFRVLWPLCSANPFARHNLEFPEQITHHANQDTVLISSPALLKRLTEEHQPTKLRCLFSSGGPLPFVAANHAQELFSFKPIEVFGSTETGGIAYRQQTTEQTPWSLFPKVEAELNHERCLRLRSAHIDPTGWYQTADECEFVSDNQFILKGRTDRIIKVEEKRVSLVEVEKRVDQLDYVQECAVIPMQQADRLILAAAIVLTESGKTKLTELGKGKFWLLLRNELRRWLEPIAVPRSFRVVKEIPLNSQGKRQVAELEKLFQ